MSTDLQLHQSTLRLNNHASETGPADNHSAPQHTQHLTTQSPISPTPFGPFPLEILSIILHYFLDTLALSTTAPILCRAREVCRIMTVCKTWANIIIRRLREFKLETRRQRRRGFVYDYAVIRTTARLERLSDWHVRDQGKARDLGVLRD